MTRRLVWVSVVLASITVLTIPAAPRHSSPALKASAANPTVVRGAWRDVEPRDVEPRAGRSRPVFAPSRPRRLAPHHAPRRSYVPVARHHDVAPSACSSSWLASLGTDERWIDQRESGLDPTPRDVNPRSGAMGLGQLLRSTYADLGLVPDFNPCHEIAAQRAYMRGRYGSWSNARAFWENHHWW